MCPCAISTHVGNSNIFFSTLNSYGNMAWSKCQSQNHRFRANILPAKHQHVTLALNQTTAFTSQSYWHVYRPLICVHRTRFFFSYLQIRRIMAGRTRVQANIKMGCMIITLQLTSSKALHYLISESVMINHSKYVSWQVGAGNIWSWHAVCMPFDN